MMIIMPKIKCNTRSAAKDATHQRIVRAAARAIRRSYLHLAQLRVGERPDRAFQSEPIEHRPGGGI